MLQMQDDEMYSRMPTKEEINRIIKFKPYNEDSTNNQNNAKQQKTIQQQSNTPIVLRPTNFELNVLEEIEFRKNWDQVQQQEERMEREVQTTLQRWGMHKSRVEEEIFRRLEAKWVQAPQMDASPLYEAPVLKANYECLSKLPKPGSYLQTKSELGIPEDRKKKTSSKKRAKKSTKKG
eukprot:TRINITY_DN5223_c0_g1_i6.p4 TRINITY_DN5223_c0_g1~~TRINITY_DN5223_c0_g1_i6.p4  ORF type:complete len:178 (-),score=26.48 TRINITY_DN5223_c0_g1_i6:509-1042(-)